MKWLKKKALLAKHDLLSEVNRIEQVSKPAPASALGSLAPPETAALLQAAPSDASQLPFTSTSGETRGPEFAALSNTSVTAKRPSGIDRRKGRPQ